MSPTSSEGREALDALRRTGATLTLAGGDPQVIAEWASAARARGFERVIAAPGREGFSAAALDSMIEAGVAGLQARLYAADAAAHDYHAGLEGSFRATVGLLRAARVARLPVTVTTPLTRSNARVLAALPGLLADVAARAWCVVFTWREGHVHPDMPAGALAPRLAVALPYALQAMFAAERVGVATRIAGAPLCLLGPLRDRAEGEAPRAFAPGCTGCELRGRCEGVDEAYLGRFGAGELVPLRAGGEARADGRPDARTASRSGRVHEREDMFSGPCLEVTEGACWPI